MSKHIDDDIVVNLQILVLRHVKQKNMLVQIEHIIPVVILSFMINVIK